MELTGRIIAVIPAQSGISGRTGNSWMSQDYVIEVPGQYPRRCVFRIFGEERIKQFAIQNGEDLTVQFDIEAREYNGRWYNDVRAYNIVRGQAQPQAAAPFPPQQPGAAPFPPQQSDASAPAAAAPAAAAPAAAPFPPAPETAGEGSADDLPF